MEGVTMDNHLVALKLFLDELGVGTDISTLADRKKVQKAVYLGQAAGADLGYRFSWYILGPYSPPLTRDYFELAEKRDEYRDTSDKYSLHAGLRDHLERLGALFEHGERLEDELPMEDWLELCASIDYQFRVVDRTLTQTRELIADHPKKRHLAAYFDEAVKALKESGLLVQPT